ncbi:exosortase-associated EpsI family protein [Pirellulales bacterium]|nr:exosortase-associated EpsI family protein [Pirellulales bacterium]
MFEKLQKNIFVPLGIVVVLLITITVIEARISDRFTTSAVSAADFVARFKEVPMDVGPWRGTNNDVDEQVKETAGAVGHVSRTYTNTTTGAQVDLWLIVGHARDILRHTPNVCYRSAGFRQLGTVNKHPIEVEGGGEAVFATAQFLKEDNHSRNQVRVFWAWNGNEPDKEKWEAPDGRRLYYGNNRALYKIYFTSAVLTDEEHAGDSVAVDFAELMLPHVNTALFPTEGVVAGDGEGNASSAEAEDDVVEDDVVEDDVVEDKADDDADSEGAE